jgi:hypothetical protein
MMLAAVARGHRTLVLPWPAGSALLLASGALLLLA